MVLTSWMNDNGIEAAAVVSAVGSLSRAHLRRAGRTSGTATNEDLEVLSLSGTLGMGGMHIHLGVADGEGRVTGGHLLDGCLVRTTLELVIMELTGVRLIRTLDPGTGHSELDPAIVP